MSIAIQPNTPIANKANVDLTQYATAPIAPPPPPNEDAEALAKLIYDGASKPQNFYGYDTYEYLIGDSSHRDFVLSDYRSVGICYAMYFGHTWTTESAVSHYEKGREGILKAFSDDEELMNAHMKAFDEEFEKRLQQLAFHLSMSMDFDRIEARQFAREGVAFEPNKIAANKDFNKDNFLENAQNVMKEFGKAFIGNIKDGLSYTDAKKNAFDYMAENFKTTSVNSLSLNDLMVYEMSKFANRVSDREVYIAQKSAFNKAFNNNTKLSAELRALLG